jgi:hypothetical protein
VDAGVSRAAASSCATAACLALLEPVRFVTGCTAFAAETGAACAAEVAGDVFLTEGITLAADVFFAEDDDPACVTFLVGSAEPLPVAIFPPVVFAIALRLFVALNPGRLGLRPP